MGMASISTSCTSISAMILVIVVVVGEGDLERKRRRSQTVPSFILSVSAPISRWLPMLFYERRAEKYKEGKRLYSGADSTQESTQREERTEQKEKKAVVLQLLRLKDDPRFTISSSRGRRYSCLLLLILVFLLPSRVQMKILPYDVQYKLNEEVTAAEVSCV